MCVCISRSRWMEKKPGIIYWQWYQRTVKLQVVFFFHLYTNFTYILLIKWNIYTSQNKYNFYEKIEWGKIMFTVVSTQNTELLLVLLFINYYILFHTKNSNIFLIEQWHLLVSLRIYSKTSFSFHFFLQKASF